MVGVCVYVDGGMGHFIPARTIQNELEKMGHEAHLEEFFNLLEIEWIGKLNKMFWRAMLKNSKMENTISRHNDKSNAMDLAVKYGIWHCSKTLMEYIGKTKPDFFFTTHPYAGTIISAILKAKEIRIPVYYFATDVFSAPIAAISNDLRRFYIATEEGRDIVVGMGMQPEKVIISPFPLQQCVQNVRNLDKKETRRKLNLEEDVFTMQFNLGGEGLGSLEILKELRKCQEKAQVIVVGGIDDEMRKRIEAIERSLPDNVALKCVGFIKNVNEYLAASDILVGRAGINTLLEAFYARKPFLITELVYTVMSSADYVEKYKLGWNCNRNPEKQVDIIIDLIEHPGKLKEMDRNFDNIPIEFSASRLTDMILKDTEDYQKENH